MPRCQPQGLRYCHRTPRRKYQHRAASLQEGQSDGIGRANDGYHLILFYAPKQKNSQELQQKKPGRGNEFSGFDLRERGVARYMN